MQITLPLSWILTAALLSLRFGVVLAFAPPFSLLAVPVAVRVLLGLAFATCVATWPPARVQGPFPDPGVLATMAGSEIGFGLVLVFVLQAAFAGLYFAGRVLDIQAGFGLALLIDPNTSNQVPLLGTLFVYTSGLFFFALDGHLTVTRILVASLAKFPAGLGFGALNAAAAIQFFGRAIGAALGLIAGAMTGLFLIDLSIAFLSRTLPQMNVLLFGLQVKTLAVLLFLAATFAVLGPRMVDLITSTLQFAAGNRLFGQPGT